MITTSGGRAIFKKPEDLFEFTNEQLGLFRKENEEGVLVFSFPKTIGEHSNEKRLVYKTGYLKEFLLILYPDVHYDEIYKMIGSIYQMFGSRRTMERNYKKYLELKKQFY